jgi:acetoin utilization deacetylase AcuC-like enzyme
VKVVHSPLHADYILKAVQRAGFDVTEPHPFGREALLRIHDAGFVEFLHTAHSEWRAIGKDGFMLPGAFPARGLRGEGYTRNFPLPRGTTWEEYSRALDAAMDTLGRFSPDALVVSLGVDTYEGDPISAFKLAARHFPLMGQRLAGLKVPTVFVQEGGYAVEDIGTNVAGVLEGFLRG